MTISRKAGSRKMPTAVLLIVKAFAGCHKTNAAVLITIYVMILCLFWLAALLGISIPRKKTSSSRDGNMNRVKGKTANIGRSIMPVENCPVPKPMTNDAHTKIGTGIKLMSGVLKGETLRPRKRLFLMYAKVFVLDHL